MNKTYKIASDLLEQRGMPKTKIKSMIAEMSGVSYQAVRKWSLGTSEPDITSIQLLAKGLGVSVGRLLGDDPGESELDRQLGEYWSGLDRDGKTFFLANLKNYLELHSKK